MTSSTSVECGNQSINELSSVLTADINGCRRSRNLPMLDVDGQRTLDAVRTPLKASVLQLGEFGEIYY